MATYAERAPLYVDRPHKTAIPALAAVGLVLFLAVLCMLVVVMK